MWWAWLSVAWGVCDLAGLTAAIDILDAALADTRYAPDPAVKEVDRRLRCQREVVLPAQIIRLHHQWAVLAARQKRPELAARHLLAAWLVSPMVEWPAGISKQSPSATAFSLLQERWLPELPTQPLKVDQAVVDGHMATWVVVGLPSVVQQPGKRPKRVKVKGL